MDGGGFGCREDGGTPRLLDLSLPQLLGDTQHLGRYLRNFNILIIDVIVGRATSTFSQRPCNRPNPRKSNICNVEKKETCIL